MPRFVVLEHAWDGVHWDVFLERPDRASLRAWAVDARIVPDRDLPARALPDHRPAYLEYEGEISGGRGTVRRVDRGEYEALDWGSERVVVVIRGAQLVGKVELAATQAEGMEDGGAVDEERAGPGWTFRLNSGNFD